MECFIGKMCRLRSWILALVSCWIVVAIAPSIAAQSQLAVEPLAINSAFQVVSTSIASQLATAEDRLAQGKQYYDAGRLREAAQSWKQAAFQFSQQHQLKKQAIALRYLAIAQKGLGELSAAEASISQAWHLVHTQFPAQLMAQLLNTRGTIQLAQAQAREAYASFRQAEKIYRDLGDRSGTILSQINQVQALQALGFYRRAEGQLLSLQKSLGIASNFPLELSLAQTTMPDAGNPDAAEADLEATVSAQFKAEILFNLGQVWKVVGNLSEAQSVLEYSASAFEQLGAKAQLASVLLLQGDIAQEQQQVERAQSLYAKAQFHATQAMSRDNNASSASSVRQILTQAQLRQLQLLIQIQDWPSAERLSDLLLSQPYLLADRWDIETQINFAESLRLMGRFDKALNLLDSALRQAEHLGDARSISYALGQQGRVYEDQGRWVAALAVTRQAQQQSAALGANEITAHWLWQAGRLLKQQGDQNAAIAAYAEAIDLLQLLRQDLVAINSGARFSFRDQVEPVYRQQVALLLQGVDALPPALKQQRLEQARQTIEVLQLAQVQDFLQEACETYDVQPIDQIDARAAVFYPIVLDNRLEVVLALPGLPLQHYGSAVSQADQQQWLLQLRQSLNPVFSIATGLPAAQQFYDQLIRPAEAWLAQQKIQTLVFVLDDFLRNIPIAVLHDGDRYLVQKYSLALTPGLQLFDATPLAQKRLQVLAAGLSQARQGFAPLPGVAQELQNISQLHSSERPARIKSQILLDQDFTEKQLARQARTRPFNVLHLATHGQFSSKASETFLLTWNERLGIGALDQWLNPRLTDASTPRSPIEMLVLSACQTARGDRRAALGLAGLAVRSGARSTLATLWSVQDQSTARLVDLFYQQLLQQGTSRSEALRQAQLALLEGDYAHPYYWAPFVLVGNWQ